MLRFDPIDRLRLDVEQAPEPGQLVNLIKNPNGDLGGWGWVTPIADTSMAQDSTPGSLIFQTTVAQAAHFLTELLPMGAGQYAAGRVTITGGTLNGGHRGRFRFLDTEGAELSMGPQTAAVGLTTLQIPAAQAPAGTAYVQLRIDMYGDGAGTTNPPADSAAVFHEAVAVVADDTEGLGSVRTNYATNPSYETGTAGVSGDSGSSGTQYTRSDDWAAAGAWSMRTVRSSGFGQVGVQLADEPCTAGEQYRISLTMHSKPDDSGTFAAGSEYRLAVTWVNGSGIAFSSHTYATADKTDDVAGVRFGAGVLAPAGAVRMRVIARATSASLALVNDERTYADALLIERGAGTLGDYFDGATPDAGGIDYAWTGTAHGSVSTATEAGQLPYIPPVTFAGILGSSVELGIDRAGLDVGELDAKIRDANLDPATAETIRPGRLVALQTLDGTSGDWHPLFTGICRRASVDYETKRAGGAQLINLITNPRPSETTNWNGANAFVSFENDAIRVVPDGASNDSFAHIDGWPGGIRNSMEAGKTYTVAATITVPATFAGGNSRKLSAQVYIKAPSLGSGYYSPLSDPGAAGETRRVSLTFTIPPDATETFLRFYNGSSGGAHWVEWSQVTLTEGAAVPAYFDGDTPDSDQYLHSWVSVPYNSHTIRTRRPEQKSAHIALSATDNTTELANVQRPEGVETIDELPHVLEGAGVPWNVNGSGDQVGSAVIVAVNDQASALDQVALTRDSALGHAWVDRRNVLNVWDETMLPATSAATLTEADYSELLIDYDTERCINSVGITFLRTNPDSGDTEEVAYGPYVDQVSVAEWGTRHADFTIQWSDEDPVTIATFADSILTANAQPAVRVNGLTLPIRDDDDLEPVEPRALLDLGDLVTVTHAATGRDEQLRIASLQHTITARRWTMAIGFVRDGQVASPRPTPSPSGGAGGRTLSELLRPVGEVSMWLGTVPAGWVELGATFDADEYPKLYAYLGNTNVVPSMSDRVPIGASGSKAVASSGGSPTSTAQASSQTRTVQQGTNTNIVQNTHTHDVDVMQPWRAVRFAVRAR